MLKVHTDLNEMLEDMFIDTGLKDYEFESWKDDLHEDFQVALQKGETTAIEINPTYPEV